MKNETPIQAETERIAIPDTKYSHRVTCSVCEASTTKDFFDRHICARIKARPKIPNGNAATTADPKPNSTSLPYTLGGTDDPHFKERSSTRYNNEYGQLPQGTKVSCNGYSAVIVRHYDGATYEVRVPGGVVATDDFELTDKEFMFHKLVEEQNHRSQVLDNILSRTEATCEWYDNLRDDGRSDGYGESYGERQ